MILAPTLARSLSAKAPVLDSNPQLPTVTLKITPSRGRVAAGEAWSLFGVVENQGSKAIYIVQEFTPLVLPLELMGIEDISKATISGYFPTSEKDGYRVVRIFPKQSYPVVWDIDPLKAIHEKKPKEDKQSEETTTDDKSEIHPGSFRDWVGLWSEISFSMRRFIFLQPGRYEVTVAMHYWLEDPKPYLDSTIEPQIPADLTGAPSIRAVVSMDVEASAWVILFGASIGGSIAYLILWLVAGREPSRISKHIALARIAGLLSAALLGGVVALFLQRIGNANFVVNININDFWGAIIVGFIAEYMGIKIIDQLLKRPPTTEQQK